MKASVGKKGAAAGPGTRGADILDQAIDALSLYGLLAIAVAYAAVAAQYDLYTALEPALTVSALMMGMGKGGVAGFSTVASAVAAAVAPAGKVRFAFLYINNSKYLLLLRSSASQRTSARV